MAARESARKTRAFVLSRRGRTLTLRALDIAQRAMLLLIDNYDSFTFNLAQYLGELGEEVQVLRNDALDVAGIRALAPSRILISPGPGTPDDAGISLDLLRELAGEIPILGVCLGHQAIGQAFGGKIVRAKQIMHGKTSMIHHSGQGLFARLQNPFEATRYHSLVVERASLPECLEITAWTQTAEGEFDEIMGLRHKTSPVEGVQFHPESILTQHGRDLLRNFLAISCRSLRAGEKKMSLRDGRAQARSYQEP
jgi:anthranilate synthase component 2